MLSSRWCRGVLGGAHLTFKVTSPLPCNDKIVCSSLALRSRSFPESDPAKSRALPGRCCVPLAPRSDAETLPFISTFREDLEEFAEVHIQVGGSWKAALAAFLPENKSCCTKVASLLEKIRRAQGTGKYIHGRKWLESPSAQTWVPSCIFLDHSQLKSSPGTAPGRQFASSHPLLEGEAS